MGRLRILRADADQTVEWDSEKPHTVAEAKQEFEYWHAMGYKALELKKGRVHRELSAFDVDASEIVLRRE